MMLDGMSDIPVGSPPAPAGRHAAASGWYPDPLDAGQERYWDGWQWSRTTRPRAGGPPLGAAAPAGAPPAASNPYGSPYAGGSAPGPGQAYYPVPTAPGRPVLTTADGVPVASWWWRALAALLDGTFTGVVGALLSLPFLRTMFTALAAWWDAAMQAAQSGANPPAPPDFANLVSTSEQLMIGLVGLAVGLAYHGTFLRLRGATPGKLICGLRVVPVDRGRAPGPLPWSTILIRAGIWVLPGVYSALFLITVVDVLLPLWHPKRQALHDLAARTQVVRPIR